MKSELCQACLLLHKGGSAPWNGRRQVLGSTWYEMDWETIRRSVMLVTVVASSL